MTEPLSKPNDMSFYSLNYADIKWQDGDIPTARLYDDIYFSPVKGIQETQYVFLNHNRLPERWNNLNPNDTKPFSIAEIGFGTGLNFLATWQLWQQYAPSNAQLHFVSTEKHPLRIEDLKRSLSKWPQLTSLTRQLIEAYPILTPGHHLIKFCQGNVNLHLLLGDATQCFEQLRATSHPSLLSKFNHTFDAWFLDGFAPAKNPELWDDSLFELIAQLSKPGTTLATFTAAGFVRRSLMQHGFQMEKVPGFDQKREMLRGCYAGNSNMANENSIAPGKYGKVKKAPWYVLPNACAINKRVVIIGAGLAGTSSAYALAQRGWQVTLIERHANAAQEASGNPQGMLYTKLSSKPGKLNNFSLSSYLYALRYYRQLVLTKQLTPSHYGFCGLLQLVNSEKELKSFRALSQILSLHPNLVQFVDAERASQLSGISIEYPAYFFPESGWISPVKLCQQLIEHPRITTLFYKEAISVNNKNTEISSTPLWDICNHTGHLLAQAEAVVIANSLDATQFTQSNHLPIKPIRGQISEIPTNQKLAKLNTILCFDGYITPTIKNKNSIGATFDIGDWDTTERQYDHQRNIEKLYQALPSLQPIGADTLDVSTVTGRASLRCTTADYLPLVGQLPDYNQFIKDYGRLRKDSNWPINTPGCYHPGLYINTGHGSRGLTSTPLCSELLAAIINNEPLTLPRYLVKALNPARFVIRDLIRNKI